MSNINWWPQDINPSIIPLTIMCGPPGSGKSSSVKYSKSKLVIDFADIKSSVSGMGLYEAGDDYLSETIEQRNILLRKLSTYEYKSAVFITNAPLYSTRKYWADLLNPQNVIVKAVSKDVCLDRISKQASRHVRDAKFWDGLVSEWWVKFNYGPNETIYID